MDGKELHNAAEYLRGRIKAVPNDNKNVSDRRVRQVHFDLYRRTRQNALALWCETVGWNHNHPRRTCRPTSTPTTPTADSLAQEAESWPDDEGRGGICLLWCSGRWHCANASWHDRPETKILKVSFPGYDEEDTVFVDPQDPRIRHAVLDPRCGRDHPNHRVLRGIFPKAGDHVRVHVIDAEEASIFLQEGSYFAGEVISPLASRDSSLVSVVGLPGREGFLVPNTRMEHVTAEDFARVVDGLKVARNKVLRQLDIATSQTIAIQVVSGVGEVADDVTPVSLWALGDQMLVKVLQELGDFMLETSVSASEALTAVGMEDVGLTVLSEDGRRQLLDRVRGRLRVWDGLLTMAMDIRPDLQGDRFAGPSVSETSKIVYHENHDVEGVSVETVVEREGRGGLRVRSKTRPPGPERVYDIVVQPEDWVSLGHPSLPWLNDKRTSSLAQELTRCVRAGDGSLVLRIGDRGLRPVGYFPMPSSLRDNTHSSRALSGPPAAADAAVAERRSNDRFEHNGHDSRVPSPCKSGAPPGLCCCRVVLRSGVSLPLSIPEPAESVADDATDINNNNDNDDGNSGRTNTTNETRAARSSRRSSSSSGGGGGGDSCSSRKSRWLVMVKVTGGELMLSLLQPSRAAPSTGGTARPAGLRGRGAATANGSGVFSTAGDPGRGEMRRSLSLVAAWADWAEAGYGPLQWMSHEQKVFIARLSLYWVSFRTPARGFEEKNAPNANETPVQHHRRRTTREAFLHFRPILSSVTRVVGKSSGDPGSSVRGTGGGGAGGGGGGSASVVLGGSSSRAVPRGGSEIFGGEETSRTSRVFVRDEGGVLRVEVVEAERTNGGRSKSGVSMLDRAFGKEAWRETGLEELLWLDCSCRQYLALRLAQQVAIVVDDDGDGRGGQHDEDNILKINPRLVIISDLPLPYWMGTVPIARLGSHAEGVFVVITDAGRRLLIEARDFERGPLLAKSTVSLEDWTATTGIATLSPPTDNNAFKKILEEQLAALLGAGFRSRTSRLERKRAAREAQHQGGGVRWRGTFLELSEMEKGKLGQLEEDDSGSENNDANPDAPPRKLPLLLSPRASTPLEQKRALRLEMLTRMVDDFHAKHGRSRRRGGGGRRRREKRGVGASAPGDARDPTTAVETWCDDESGVVGHDGERGRERPVDIASDEGQDGENDAHITTANQANAIQSNNNNDDDTNNSNNSGGDNINNNDNTRTAFPAIFSSTPPPPNPTPSSSNPAVGWQATPAEENGASATDTGTSVDGESSSARFLTGVVPPTRLCVCCGGEGGRGHGRKCEHTFRRCGFCRVEEVRRVLRIRAPGRTREPVQESMVVRVPSLPQLKFGDVKDGDDEGEEFEWVTDSDEEGPEFECDSCGRVMEGTADRFHCETCGDYDLCQACCLSHKVAKGHNSKDEGGATERHDASHSMTRIMGKPAVPGRLQ